MTGFLAVYALFAQPFTRTNLYAGVSVYALKNLWPEKASLPAVTIDRTPKSHPYLQ
jgi:hypothetical protein